MTRRPVKAAVYRTKYLYSPHWRATREVALSIARFRCQACKRKNPRLDVHHLTYERLGHEWYADVIVLCRPCHTARHQRKRRRA